VHNLALQAASEVAETDRIAAVRVETTRRITQLVPSFTVMRVTTLQTHHACTQTHNQQNAKGSGAVLLEAYGRCCSMPPRGPNRLADILCRRAAPGGRGRRRCSWRRWRGWGCSRTRWRPPRW
jgi:hypothetical protein